MVVVAIAGALCGLGVWQIERGEAKQQMLAQYRQASQATPRPLAPQIAGGDAMAKKAYGQHYSVTGTLDANHQIMLDNQVLDGQVGYRVWTPLILADGTQVMVDRGWVPVTPGGRDAPPSPPAPAQPVQMTGRWRDLPQAGLHLGGGDACQTRAWPRVLNYPMIEQLRCQYDRPVANGLLLLAEDDPRGFARDWDAALNRMPPLRHYGYAFQWFALALAVAVIFLFVNLKRRS